MAMGDGKCRTTPDLPWKTRFLLAAFCFGVDASRRSNGTVNRRLMSLFDPKSPPSSSKPINGVTSSDVTVDASRNLWFRLYAPAGDSRLPLIVYFHGGGFAFCTADSKGYHDFCRRLAGELPAVVVSVNYRLSPEHRCPSQYDDGFDALKFMDSEAAVQHRSEAVLHRGRQRWREYSSPRDAESPGWGGARVQKTESNRIDGDTAVFRWGRADGIGAPAEESTDDKCGAYGLDVEGVSASWRVRPKP
uniref:Putative carboxylesterase 18 n=1 Tax=Davidia involucrata TaxID=16924 RepID=A0A5B6ZBX7_DAVIN